MEDSEEVIHGAEHQDVSRDNYSHVEDDLETDPEPRVYGFYIGDSHCDFIGENAIALVASGFGEIVRECFE